jgi:aspartyl aminopeptidase
VNIGNSKCLCAVLAEAFDFLQHVIFDGSREVFLIVLCFIEEEVGSGLDSGEDAEFLNFLIVVVENVLDV